MSQVGVVKILLLTYNVAMTVEENGQQPCFKLKPFAVTWQCVCRCWEEGVFIDPLLHRFWKLSVQVSINIQYYNLCILIVAHQTGHVA